MSYEAVLYMCATEYQHELGIADGGARVYASVSDLKKCRPCVEECGIVAIKVQCIGYEQEPKPISEWKTYEMR